MRAVGRAISSGLDVDNLPHLGHANSGCYLHIEFGSRSDQGKVRTSNEDSYAASAKHRLFLVADGMGGHAAGEVASQIAASTVEEIVALRCGSDKDPENSLRLAVEEANSRIYEAARIKREFAGMGSTLTVLAFRDDHYYVAHVGDSRAYLLREGVLDQLTRDHSLVWHLLESGVLRKDELSSHPQKNLITRSIGPHPSVEVDLERGEAQVGDVFLLCSDGLTDVVSDENIRSLLSSPSQSPQEIGDMLVDTANKHGGPDNVTVVVVRLAPGDSKEDDTGKFKALS
jgi:serine/threonine protein phosphatase PrpC